MASRTLRADAARNRALILDAARELFAREGLEVSMRQIAKHAGVGEPTLRRRFATKEQLVAEAFEDKVARFAELAEQALAEPDAAEAMRGLLDAITQMQVVDRGFADVLTTTFPALMRCEQLRQRAYTSLEQVIARAKEAGVIRPDFSPEDIVLLLVAHAGVIALSGAVGPAFAARLRAYLYESFGLPDTGELPPAPSPGEVHHALMRLHETTKKQQATGRRLQEASTTEGTSA